jgi:hypothetical protein
MILITWDHKYYKVFFETGLQWFTFGIKTTPILVKLGRISPSLFDDLLENSEQISSNSPKDT